MVSQEKAKPRATIPLPEFQAENLSAEGSWMTQEKKNHPIKIWQATFQPHGCQPMVLMQPTEMPELVEMTVLATFKSEPPPPPEKRSILAPIFR